MPTDTEILTISENALCWTAQNTATLLVPDCRKNRIIYFFFLSLTTTFDKEPKKKRSASQNEDNLFLKWEAATTYPPERWPAEYFRRKKA